MKRIKFIFLLALATVLISCEGKSPLVGTWKLNDLLSCDENLTENEKEGTWKFNEDGTCEMRGELMKGKWKLSDGQKTLTFEDDNGELQGVPMTITELTESTFSYTSEISGDCIVQFKKIE